MDRDDPELAVATRRGNENTRMYIEAVPSCTTLNWRLNPISLMVWSFR